MHRSRMVGCTVLLVVAVAGCGGNDNDGSTTAPKRGLSAEPIERGYYAGITCTDAHCADYSHFKANAVLYCKGGGHLGRSVTLQPVPGSTRKPSYVCFRLVPANPTQTSATPNLVKFFYIRTQQVLGQAHVSADSFPSTGDNGWQVGGEWFGPEDISGRFRNPSGTSGYYTASWYSR